MNKSYTVYGYRKWEEYIVDQFKEFIESRGDFVNINLKWDYVSYSGVDYWDMEKDIIFQNDQTGQFFTINHADQHDDICEQLISNDKCICVFKCQYRSGSYGKYDEKVSPFTYGVKRKEYADLRTKMLDIPSESNLMYFKGNETGVNRLYILPELAKMGLINHDYGIRNEEGDRNQKISQEEYLRNMAKSKLALSLPGIGNLCHREIEAFGIGVPVLMPVILNQYYDNLVPNVHYVAVETPVIEKKNQITEENTRDFCTAIRDRYYDVIDDYNFLFTIAKNAMRWFDRNIQYPQMVLLAERILQERFNYEL